MYSTFLLKYTADSSAVLSASARLCLLIYAGLLGLTYLGFRTVPSRLHSRARQGLSGMQRPVARRRQSYSAPNERCRKSTKSCKKPAESSIPSAFPAIPSSLDTNITNVGGMFIILDPFEHRKHDPELSAAAIEHKLRRSLMAVQEAQVVLFGAPPVDGLGNTGGFKLQVQDKGDIGFTGLEAAVTNLAQAGNAQPGLVGLFSSFRATSRNSTSTSIAQRPKAWGWISVKCSMPYKFTSARPTSTISPVSAATGR